MEIEKIIIPLASISCVSLSNAAIFAEVATDANGAFSAGGWSGSGAVQANAGSAGPLGQSQLIDDTSGGTLNMGRTGLIARDTGWGNTIGSTYVFSDITGQSVLTVTGGTVDISTYLISTSGGQLLFNYGINGFSAGVTSFTFATTFSSPVAANRPGPSAVAPFLGAIDYVSGGAAQVTTQYLGLVSSSDGGTTFQPGIGSTVEAINLTNNNFSWAPGSDSASFTIDTSGEWQGINGFDIDGGGLTQGTIGGNVEDMELVYARGISFTVTPDASGTFASDSQFIFSFNGGTWEQTLEAATIPESSGVMLILSTLGLACVRRKRVS